MTSLRLSEPDHMEREVYEAPRVTVLGTVTEITQIKAFNASDGASFFGAPEGVS
jgi:hypothetical protein